MGLQKPAEEILTESTLGASAEAITSAVDLTNSSHFTLTVEVDFDPEANAGLKCHLRSSYDKSNWDTQDVGANEEGNWNIPNSFNMTEYGGSSIQHTVPIEEVFKYARLHIVNEATVPANNVSVTRTTQEVEAY